MQNLIRLFKFIKSHPLNNGRFLPAMSEFLRWQVACRLHNGDLVYNWIGPIRFFVRKGESGLTQNLYTGLCEFEEMGFLLHFLTPEDLFIDAGANAGSYTLLASVVIGANVISVEPCPDTYLRLTANIKLNTVGDKVAAEKVSLGSEEGSVKFSTDYGPMNHVLREGESSSRTVTVRQTTLDRIVGSESPSLIKIDVEGYEYELLRGASDTLNNQELNAVILEMNSNQDYYGSSSVEIVNIMDDYGFRMFRYDPVIRTLSPYNIENIRKGNVLFIRNIEAVKALVSQANPFEMHGKKY